MLSSWTQVKVFESSSLKSEWTEVSQYKQQNPFNNLVKKSWTNTLTKVIYFEPRPSSISSRHSISISSRSSINITPKTSSKSRTISNPLIIMKSQNTCNSNNRPADREQLLPIHPECLTRDRPAGCTSGHFWTLGECSQCRGPGQCSPEFVSTWMFLNFAQHPRSFMYLCFCPTDQVESCSLAPHALQKIFPYKMHHFIETRSWSAWS